MKNAFALLAAFIVCTLFLSSDITAQPKKSMRMDRDGFMDNARLINELNLTDEQKDKVRDLRIQHKKEMIDLKAELEKRELELAEIKNKDNISRNEVIASVENINRIKNEISLKVANHKMDIYELLTTEQKEIWKDKQHYFGMGHKKMFNKKFHDGW